MNSGDSMSVLNQKMENYKQENDRITMILAEKKEDLATQSEKYEIEIFSKSKQIEDLRTLVTSQSEKVISLEKQLEIMTQEILVKTKSLIENERSLVAIESAMEQVQISTDLEAEKLKLAHLEVKREAERIKRETQELQQELNAKEEIRNQEYEKQVKIMNQTVQDATEKGTFYLTSLQDAISRVNDPNMIDKRILTKLLLRFLEEKEEYLIPLMEKMLGLNDVEKERFLSATGSSSGWFGMGGSRSSNSRSLSELWVDFLISETK
jgi:hypothetical protein